MREKKRESEREKGGKRLRIYACNYLKNVVAIIGGIALLHRF